MAVLTKNIDRKEKEGNLVESPVVAADIIYQGALVKHNAAGFIAPCAAEIGAVFAGVAYEKVDNSAGAAGDKSVRVEKNGSFLMTMVGLTQADVGSAVYATDDDLVSLVQAANQQLVGYIVQFVSATQARVRIDNVAI
jgi:hypothetical protein